jgi:hypothetical protein
MTRTLLFCVAEEAKPVSPSVIGQGHIVSSLLDWAE